MQITDLLAQAGGLQAIARELGIDERQASAGAAALAPAVLGGLKKQVQGQAGGAGLGALLSQLGGGGLLDNVVSPEPTDLGRGNAVLGQIFGTKDVSRTVAHSAAAQSGLDEGVLKKMLPMVAMLVTGYMAKQSGGTGAAAAGGGLGSLLGGLMGGGQGGGLLSMLDFDGDGNPLDDILGMVGGKRG